MRSSIVVHQKIDTFAVVRCEPHLDCGDTKARERCYPAPAGMNPGAVSFTQ